MSTTQELIEQLRKGTAGLTLYEIEALWGEAATALSATEKERNLTGARFFIDHGQIHDRVTGKHVTTDEDSVFCDGINSALELLNGLDASVRAAAALIVALVNNSATIISALREVSALKEEVERLHAQDWQPIETAPKDGRKALVYRPLARNSGDEPVAIKRLVDTDNTCWDCTVPPDSEPCNPTDGSCHVTHWRPLPDPPARAAIGGAG